MSDLSTREKILKISHKLFADRGLHAVSIREIAKECDVNVAAVNYHFQNKEKLYLETIKESVLGTERDLKDLYDSLEIKETENFLLKVYDYFLENAEDLRTAFKLIISSEKYMEAMEGHIDRFTLGPPGGEFFGECIKNEVPHVSSEDLEWAVRCLFTQVLHKALIMCNQPICHSLKVHGVEKNLLREDIKRLTKTILKEISR